MSLKINTRFTSGSRNESETITTPIPTTVNVLDLIKCRYYPLPPNPQNPTTYVILPKPLKGCLFITKDNPSFISGHIRVRGKQGGQYPYKFLQMIDYVFGFEKNTIEVCSGKVTGLIDGTTTVDINPYNHPTIVDNGESLTSIKDSTYNRWRSDPPYNTQTASKMYGTSLPNPLNLLKAGARVCKPGSLLFLLLGPQNYQIHPAGVKRIGYINLTIVPNNETRCLNIFYKLQ